MPSLRISVDGSLVASVCTDGLDSLGVHVSGTRVDEDIATLYVAGGSYPQGGSSNYLIWVDSLPVKAGQEIVVLLVESEPNSHHGKTIEELGTGETAPPETDFTPTVEVFEQLRGTPLVRERYNLRFTSSIGKSFIGQTARDDHGFSLTVHWNSFHPERARLSLHSYTLAALEKQEPVNDHVEEKMYVGNSVRFQLDA